MSQGYTLVRSTIGGARASWLAEGPFDVEASGRGLVMYPPHTPSERLARRFDEMREASAIGELLNRHLPHAVAPWSVVVSAAGPA